MSDLVASIAWDLVRSALFDVQPYDARRYFELAYRDPDIQLLIRTDSSLTAQKLAEALVPFLKDRMLALKAAEDRRRLGK
jgi:hypothetical protein